MATWQYAFHLIPATSIKASEHQTLLSIAAEERDARMKWTDEKALEEATKAFDRLSHRRSSWTKAITAWGDESADDIQVHRFMNDGAEIRVRLDVREINHTLLAGVVEVAERIGAAVLTGENYVLRPSAMNILKAVQRSPAARFVADPEGFLSNLPKS